MGSSGGGDTTVTNVPSPEQSEAFRFRMEQAQAGLGNLPGAAGYFTNSANSPFNLTDAQRQAITGMQQAAGNLPPDPLSNYALQAYPGAAQQYWNTASAGIPTQGQWNQGATGLYDQMTTNSGGLFNYLQDTGGQLFGYLQGRDPAQMNGWMEHALAGGALAGSPINVGSADMGAANVDFTAAGATYDPVSVGTMAPVDVKDIDPTRALEAARNHLETISSPAIRNALQAGGLGRSGAEAEALAQEGVRLELPIEQQILQAEAQANQLEAQIQARQEEVVLLQEQAAKLQAQSLTATSREMAQQINGQLAGIEAQIRGRLAEANLMAQSQAAIAQRTSALQYASNTLGQLGSMNMGQNQLLAGTGTNLLGMLGQTGTNLIGQMGQTGTNLLGQLNQSGLGQYQGQIQAGQGILNNLTQQGLMIPNLQSQQYQNQLMGAQTGLQASSLEQQAALAQWQNYQNYVLSLLGATPLPGQIPGGQQQSQSNPGWLNYAGTAAMLGSLI